MHWKFSLFTYAPVVKNLETVRENVIGVGLTLGVYTKVLTLGVYIKGLTIGVYTKGLTQGVYT